MNNVEQIVDKSSSIQEYAKSYLEYLTKLMNALDFDKIAEFINELEDSKESENMVFVLGNGGSAGTASHMANDIGLDVLKKTNVSKPYRIMSLTDNIPVITAIGNDDGYENVFLYQLQMYYRLGDKIIVISASGNSGNLVEAAEWVKARGGKVLGLLGFDGGKLKELCDTCIHVETPKGEYGPVEDMHMIMDHLMVNYILCKEK